MRPKRYPYSKQIKASTTEMVKAWGNCYSDFLAKNQEEQERAKQELDKATQKLYQLGRYQQGKEPTDAIDSMSAIDIQKSLDILSEKVTKIEQILEPDSKIVEGILNTLSTDRGIIVDPDVGTARGARGVSGADMMAILGK